MKMRYHDILDYDFSVNQEVLNCKLPKIILQPIIENAIYHGIKNTLKQGKVEIIIQKHSDSMLYIAIRDTGIGMQPEDLEELCRSINTEDNVGESYGLKNINQRIKLFFGRQYGLEIESRYHTGTLVKIVVPMIQ